MLKYNDDNIFTGYIKQLLHSFNLPMCHVGYDAQYKDNKRSLHYLKGNTLYFYDVNDNSLGYRGTRVQNYKFGDKIQNLTKNLEIKSNLYDTYTHEYLGDYLRFVRDYTGLNLMSMYNCFSNNSAINLDMKISESVSGGTIYHEFNSNAEHYTVFVVPVKFNQKYTIAIDWHGTIEMFAGLYHNGNRVKSSTFSSDSHDNNTFNTSTYKRYSGMRFNHPVVYDRLSKEYLEKNGFIPDFSKEECLKLFIKVPNECKSSIVILEGDYSKDTEMYINSDKFQVLGNRQLLYKPVIITGENTSVQLDEIYDANTNSTEYQYITKHQLLFVNTETHYLIADRLIEYLSGNVIDCNDEIVNNIAQLQRKILYDRELINPTDNIPLDVEHLGYWNNSIREFLYRFIQYKGLNNKYFDLQGYLDKDLETKIGNFDTIISANKEESDSGE